MDRICAELEALDESQKESRAKSAKTKPKPKRSKSTRKSFEEDEEAFSSIQHSCYTTEKSLKIVSLPPLSSLSKKSKCNKKTTPNKQARLIAVKTSSECECDDESKFVHDGNAKSDGQQRCEKSCCFDIIAYWNKLVEEDEAKARMKVVPRRLKVNYVDEPSEITAEEKREYYENKAHYLALRMERRERLMKSWMLFSKNKNLTLIKHS